VVKTGHDSSGRNAGGLGDLFIRKSLNLPQGKHGAVLGGQGIKGGLQLGGAFMALGLLARILYRDRFGGRLDGVIAGRERQEAVEPAPAFAQMVEGAAGGDGMQPGAELGLAAEAGELLPDLDPDLLADVAGIRLVADDGIHETEGFLVLSPHHGAERRLVTGLGPPDQVRSGLGGGRGFGGHGGRQTGCGSSRFHRGHDDARIQGQVDMHQAPVEGRRIRPAETKSIGFAQRDMTPGILIEQRVEKQPAGPCKG
jgi:hypothetical protein